MRTGHVVDRVQNNIKNNRRFGDCYDGARLILILLVRRWQQVVEIIV